MALLLPAIGDPREVTPKDGREFTLEELQAIVGGYIEALRTPDGRWMFLDEHGKQNRRPINVAATVLMLGWIRPDDVIVGDAIICTAIEAGEEGDDA